MTLIIASNESVSHASLFKGMFFRLPRPSTSSFFFFSLLYSVDSWLPSFSLSFHSLFFCSSLVRRWTNFLSQQETVLKKRPTDIKEYHFTIKRRLSASGSLFIWMHEWLLWTHPTIPLGHNHDIVVVLQSLTEMDPSLIRWVWHRTVEWASTKEIGK